eukprot:GHVN01034003.1.p1 GENE.GHVN01034003.1~~GHVN01034003.1.p1  ORF type:complete len:100 (-),score=10.82 GHVN01034003.1:93-392(-)
MKEGRSLLVRNLKRETSPQRLRKAFEEFGTVRDVYLPLDFHNKTPRGFGFVEFLDSKGADIAREKMDNTEVDSNVISLRDYGPREAKIGVSANVTPSDI